jgi:hypothetical protein
MEREVMVLIGSGVVGFVLGYIAMEIFLKWGHWGG